MGEISLNVRKQRPQQRPLFATARTSLKTIKTRKSMIAWIKPSDRSLSLPIHVDPTLNACLVAAYAHLIPSQGNLAPCPTPAEQSTIYLKYPFPVLCIQFIAEFSTPPTTPARNKPASREEEKFTIGTDSTDISYSTGMIPHTIPPINPFNLSQECFCAYSPPSQLTPSFMGGHSLFVHTCSLRRGNSPSFPSC